MSNKHKHEKKSDKLNIVIRKLKTFFILIITLISLTLVCLGSYNIIISIGIFNNNILNNISTIYIGVAIVTFVPTLYNVFTDDIELTSYKKEDINESKFNRDNMLRLQTYNEYMSGTLKFWKKNIAIYKNLHYYSAIWTTIISVMLPILIQLLGASEKNILTIISAHSAIIIAICKGFKVENKYQLYRMCESNFYDRYRALLNYDQFETDNDKNVNENTIVEQYMKDVDEIRKSGRRIETDNAPEILNRKVEEKKVSE